MFDRIAGASKLYGLNSCTANDPGHHRRSVQSANSSGSALADDYRNNGAFVGNLRGADRCGASANRYCTRSPQASRIDVNQVVLHGILVATFIVVVFFHPCAGLTLPMLLRHSVAVKA